MILGLKVIHLSENSHLLPQVEGDVFMLRTCQRTLVVGHNQKPMSYLQNQKIPYLQYRDEEAYEFLLQTICGLQSRMLGENEIVAQFKSAYSEYLKLPHKNSHLMYVLEKLFKDAKNIRTRFLHEIGQYSYAGMTRRFLTDHAKNGDKVLILGSGALAHDLTKMCSKYFDLMISARNSQAAEKLAQTQGLEIVPWGKPMSWSERPFIVNTIGATDLTLLEHNFFQEWKKTNATGQHLFIDLGSPSVIDTSYQRDEGIIRLNDIFHDVQGLNERKDAKIQAATSAIGLAVTSRLKTGDLHYPFGWEELQFG